MTPRRTKFYRDKHNGKWLGVCAGIADYAGIDVLLVRIGLVLLTVIGGFPWTLIAYLIAGWTAPVKPNELYEEDPEERKFWQGVRSNPRRTTRDVRSRLREIDRRLADIETYVTSSDSRLAREIESLR